MAPNPFIRLFISSLTRTVVAALTMGGVTALSHAQCSTYALTSSTGASIVPGTTDIGNHGDDDNTVVALPFPVSLYGTTYNALNAASNGNIQFTTNSNSYSNSCLPSSDLGAAVAVHWDDLRTDGPGEGIFTSVTGSAPSRAFNIEWRAHYYNGPGTANFEARLFEDNSRVEIVFGQVDDGAASATVGIQHPTYPSVQFSCNTAGLVSNGTRLTFVCYNGPSGTAAAVPNPVYACGAQGTTLLTATVTAGTNPPSTGITVTADLTAIGGAPGQIFYNDGTHGDAGAGDGVWSFRITVPPTVPPGDKSLPYTLADAQGRSTSGVLGLTVNPCASTGPDVTVRSLTDVNYYGSLGNISAYAIGTDACNRGDYPVLWIQGGTQHPVIAQNMYRLKNGRFEQIGQSFLKHAFESLNSPGCGTCVQPQMGGAQLGVGCSDVYGAGYNGGQGNLGPRSTCNATTGVFTWPPPPPPGNVIGQRLQVYTSDIDPALNPGAQYFGEAQYVTADDAQWTHAGAPSTNGLNNATYQGIVFTSTNSAPSLSGPPHPMSPAIQAWKDVDPAVSIAFADYTDTALPGPGIVCRFWVATKATNNGNGTWHYEYAVHNLNADRCGGSFSIPVARNVTVTNIGFHGVFAHSGEPFPNTAANPDNWTGTFANGAVTWTCPEAFLPPNGDNGNALRWGTLYNFRFDANIAPGVYAAPATIGLYKPATVANPATSATALTTVPGTPCGSADFNCDGDVGTDSDINAFFDCLSGTCPAAPCTNSADFNGDGDVGTDADIEAFFRVLAGGNC